MKTFYVYRCGGVGAAARFGLAVILGVWSEFGALQVLHAQEAPADLLRIVVPVVQNYTTVLEAVGSDGSRSGSTNIVQSDNLSAVYSAPKGEEVIQPAAVVD